MKTVIAVLLALSGGAALGVAAVAGVQASLDPDSGIETSNQTINVLDYGARNSFPPRLAPHDGAPPAPPATRARPRMRAGGLSAAAGRAAASPIGRRRFSSLSSRSTASVISSR